MIRNGRMNGNHRGGNRNGIKSEPGRGSRYIRESGIDDWTEI